MRFALPFCRTLLFLPLAGGLVVSSRMARASDFKWIEPTAAELAMTAEPKAPGAPAIILSYSETDDASTAEIMVHVRIKVLTEGGLSAGTVNVPDRIVRNDRIGLDYYGRTIHPDGTIVVFSGTPQDSTVVDGFFGPHRVLALPGVTVGSIVEYGWHSRPIYKLSGYLSPFWRVQQQYFVRSASFAMQPPQVDSGIFAYWTHKLEPEDVRWSAKLPPGASVIRKKSSFFLDVQDVPAASVEEFMPPALSTFFNVRFFFYDQTQQDKYWGETGGRVDSFWNDFAIPTKLLKNGVQDLVLPSDNDETKLRKIYLAVQKMDNTDLSRAHGEHEEKAEGQKTSHDADAIWLNKRGDSEELTLLFVALARAAGYQAHVMAVASRDHAVFDRTVLTWAQLDARVAIVNLNGRELFFDPGMRMCPFARMSPEHANVTGVSTEAKLVKIRATPQADYASHTTDRTAELKLGPDGSVTGRVTVVWTGSAGMAMRREALRKDARAVEKVSEAQLQEVAPEGVVVKLVSLTGLDDPDAPLKASFLVSGKLGASTGKRLIVPAQFFASKAKRILMPETRTMPLAFPAAYLVHDRTVVVLPAELAVEALPQAHAANVDRDAAYRAEVQSGENAHDQTLLVSQRTLMMKRIDYKTEEYGSLHRYFGDVANGDGEQIVLKSTAVSGTGLVKPGAE